MVLLLLLRLLVIESPPEEHDVWLWTMNGVMDPSTALLHSYRTPLIFGEKTILREKLSGVRRKHDVPVLESVVEVFVRVLDLTHLFSIAL